MKRKRSGMTVEERLEIKEKRRESDRLLKEQGLLVISEKRGPIIVNI